MRLRVRGDGAPGPPRVNPQPNKYGRWRALTLAGVYVLMALHVVHWKLKGTTLAPLELNEVMYTLELGIVTAGFLFMAAMVLGTVIFGRFFCSWACHILALQDLCAWLLERVRVRPKPVRSRVLLLVPPLALFYMFIWPQIVRVFEGRAMPRFQVFSDEEGWASFVTDDFWRNLPDPWIATLTFFVCGFVIIYFLGSRSFCQYACPYGALFAAVDRVAPGRIKLTGTCEQCGHCTAVCTSHVRVHEEIARFGKVVDPSCMKDLDCISTCPHQAITFGFTKPALLASFSRTGRRRLKYDFTLAEDALMVGVFLGVLLTYRGLYDTVPFLMTLGLGGIFAYTAVLCLRLWRRPDVRFNRFQLKRNGGLTAAGQIFASLALVAGMFTVHSAFIRYHEVQGGRAYQEARRERAAGHPPPFAIVSDALGHLQTCERWGFFQPVGLHERLAGMYLMRDDLERGEVHLHAVLARRADDLEARRALAEVMLARGRRGEAIEQLREVARLEALQAAPAEEGPAHHDGSR